VTILLEATAPTAGLVRGAGGPTNWSRLDAITVLAEETGTPARDGAETGAVEAGAWHWLAMKLSSPSRWI